MPFNPIANPVDFVVIGGQRSPGVATVVGVDSPRRVIERNGYGLSGATARFAGVLNAKPKVEIRLWESQHFEDWSTFREVVAAPPLGQRPRALEIEHPQTAAANIRAILVTNVKEPELETDTGKWLAVIEFIQFRQPSFTVSAPDGALAGPEDPLDIDNAALTALLDRLAGTPGSPPS